MAHFFAALRRTIARPSGRAALLLLAAVFFLLIISACDLIEEVPDPTPTAKPVATATFTPSGPTNTPDPNAPTPTETVPPTDTVAPLPTTPPLPTFTEEPTPTSPPSIPKGGTLTIRISRDVTTLNPFLVQKSSTDIDQSAQMVTSLIFSGLTKIDNRLRPQPDLAELWTVAPDGLSIDFQLRKDAKWHDGQPVTVDDVIWSYNTWLSLPYPTPLQFQMRDAVLQIQAGDPGTNIVRFYLKKPFAPVLTYVSAPILPKHLLGDVKIDQLASAAFSFNPVGSGPFKFSEHKEGENVVLVENPDYYGGAPNISRVAFLVAPDENVAAQAVTDGSLSLAEVNYQNWQGFQGTNGANGMLALAAYPDLGYYFVAFNLRENHAFSDRRLRQAWAYALNKEQLVASATNGMGRPIWNDIAPVSWAYSPDTPKLDNNPDMARQLLDEAGWTDSDGDGIRDKFGEPLQVTMYVRADDPVRIAAANNMVEPLKAVGIGLTVSTVDFNSVLRAKLDPNQPDGFTWHVMMLGWDSSSFDPDSFALFHSSQITSQANPQGLNYSGFASAEYDALSFTARGSFDYGQRAQEYARMQQIIGQELPYYFLWSDQHFMVLNSHVKGPVNIDSPRFLWNVERWWIEP